MPCLSHDVSEVTLNLRKVTDFVSRASAKDLTAADRTALRALLDELEALVRTTERLDQQHAD